MANEDKKYNIIKEHIKKRLNLGHDIMSIRGTLIEKGIQTDEINKAVDVAYKELHMSQKQKEFAREFLWPSKGKFILPAIILVLLLLHLFANVYILPDVGKNLCESAKMGTSITEFSKTIKLDAESRQKLTEMQKEALDLNVKTMDAFKSLLITNFPLAFSKTYMLNPFFPLPCETQNIVLVPSKTCVYYISESNYFCINSAVNAKDETMMKLFGGKMPEYKRFSAENLILNSIILLLAVYLASCIIAYIYRKTKSKMNDKMVKITEMTVIVLGVIVIILAILLYIYILKMITL